jgi:hypothetical protein
LLFFVLFFCCSLFCFVFLCLLCFVCFIDNEIFVLTMAFTFS